MIRAVAAIALALMLAGCATTQTPEPVVRTVTVNVPVPAPCVPASLAPPPEYPDTDSALLKAVDAAERYLLMAAGRMLRDARLTQLETVVAACPKVGK